MILRRLVLTVGIIVLIISLALNYYLINQSSEYYRDLNATRLDPLGLNHYPIESETENSGDRIRVVFFGDSRAASWPAPLGLDQFDFTNRGIGAQTSAQVFLRFDEHVAPLKPQLVVVQVGINDLKTVPLFPESVSTIIENCKTNIERIVTMSSDLGANVILTTIFPVGFVPFERRLFWSDDIPLAVDEVNAYIRSLAREDVIILDTYSLLANSEGVMRSEFAIDTLHVNATGYEVLNQHLVTVLTSLQS
jgi:lysophospholipase L1-like esterase